MIHKLIRKIKEKNKKRKEKHKSRKLIQQYSIQESKNITIKIADNNTLKIGKNCHCSNLNIQISGKNNALIIGDNLKCNGLLSIMIDGNNNHVVLGNDIFVVSELKIYNIDNCLNGSIQIGNKTSFYKTEIIQYESGSSIVIGDDCMFGYNTSVSNSDGHAIYQEGKLLNGGAKKIKIGNHVWIGGKVSILKNTTIQDNCILGKCAVVVGKFLKPNCILAGCPAKIIRENCNWDRRSLNQLEEGGSDE